MVSRTAPVQRGGGLDAARFLLYLPRLVAAWPVGSKTLEQIGTLVFADISGFTALTERLAGEGDHGVEQVTDGINGVFTEILTIARLEGGDLLSFGGDAVLLLFTGDDHPRRALAAAVEMQDAVIGRGGLQASIGVAGGAVRLVVAGSRQRMVFAIGPVVDDVVACEAAAKSGEVVSTAGVLVCVEPGCRGDARGPGFLVVAAPQPSDIEIDESDPGTLDPGLGAYVPAALHSELAVTGADAEQRQAVVGFVQVLGLSGRLEQNGAEGVAGELDALVDRLVHHATAHRMTVLASDIDADGAKIVITGGVPHAVPEPHERMMRSLRAILAEDLGLELRAGVADGPVFAGDLGAAFRRAYTVIGDAVNLAARLAGTAGAGQVIASAGVALRLGDRFELDERPPVRVKGKSPTVRSFVVGAARAADTDARVTVPLIGRDAELATIGKMVDTALRDRGGVVQIVGSAGIGKTRLVRELGSFGVEVVTVRCLEYEQSTAYRVIGSLIRRSAGIEMESTSEEAGLALQGIVDELAPNLAPMLPLIGVASEATVAPTAAADALDPRFIVAATAAALLDLATAISSRPLIVVIEDADWIDPASREILTAMIERSADRPWLWVITSRQGAGWAGGATLELPGLRPSAIDLLMRSVAPGIAVGDRMIERAGGNPLFALELAAAGSADAVPETVERLIADRIDRLDARERRLLRYASVLGTEFDLDLLAEALAPIAAGLDDAAAWAAIAEFISVSPLGKVRFEQSLVRDVAYRGLSFKRRSEIHAQVAQTIERRARHRSARFAAVLSLHYEAAGIAPKAWEFSLLGGDRAAGTWATAEAVVLYRRALDAAARFDPDPSEVHRVALALADAADLTGDFETVERALDVADSLGSVDAALGRVRRRARLAEKRGELDNAAALLDGAVLADGIIEPEELEALMMLAGIRHRQGRYEESARWCRAVLEVDGVETRPLELAHALDLLSLNQTHLGEPDRRRNAERALAILESEGQWAATRRVLNNLAIDSYYRGRWDEAADLYRRGRDASERAGDVILMATFDNNLAEILSDQGHFAGASELFDTGRRAWERAGYPVGLALVDSNRGRLAVRMREPERGIELLRSALERLDQIGAAALAFEAEMRVVEGLIVAGRVTEASSTLAELDDRIASETGLGGYQGVVGRLRGHVASLDGDRGAAIDLFERAAEMLEGQAYERALALAALGRLGDVVSAERSQHALAALGADSAFILPL
jgi:class 3 adenylate cyclase/tetratricopeptide (TPR) repeat protein